MVLQETWSCWTPVNSLDDGADPLMPRTPFWHRNNREMNTNTTTCQHFSMAVLYKSSPSVTLASLKRTLAGTNPLHRERNTKQEIAILVV